MAVKKVFEKNCNNSTGRTILALAFLFIVFFLQSENVEAYIPVSNVHGSDVVGSTTFTNITSNYAYSWGVGFADTYSNINTVYFNACSNITTTGKLLIWDITGTPHVVATTSDLVVRNCSDYSSTTTNYNDYSYGVFEQSQTIGNNQYVVVIHLDDSSNSHMFYSTSNTSDGFISYGCVNPAGSFNCNNYDSSYTFGFVLDTIKQSTSLSSDPIFFSSDYYNTRFTDFSISSTTGYVDFQVDYYLDESEFDSEISSRNPTQISVSISESPTNSYTTKGYNIDNSLFGSQTLNDTWNTYLNDGSYDVLVKFSNVGCTTGLSECPFAESYIYYNFTLTGGSITSTSSVDIYDQQRLNSWQTTGESPYYLCNIGELTGCLKNVIVWSFLPNDFSLGFLNTTLAETETKIPFIYAFQFYDQIELLASNATGTVPTLTVDFPFLGNITLLDNNWFSNGSLLDTSSSLIRTLSVYVFYLSLAIVLYKRTRKFTYSLTNSYI